MDLLRTLIAGSLALLSVGAATPSRVPATISDAGGASSTAPAAFAAGDVLSVGADTTDGRSLQTADGRRVYLRGVNVNALVDYGGVHDTVPVTDDDARQAAALGFTIVRLGVSWSKVEPQAGAFDAAYLDQVRATARRFVDAGIYVLLDLHQDRYAAGLGPSGDESDGAPRWAAKTDGQSTAKDSGGHPYYGTAASRAAANAFFTNATVAGKGLQEHYADAVARVAAVGEDLGPGLAGVELYNEPVDPVATDPFATDTFTADRLHPLYRRLIDRLRGPDGTGPAGGAYAGPIWFEGHATRTWTDDDRAAARFSDDPNLVYGPHVYTDVFDGEIGEGTRVRLAESFDDAAREASVYGAALAPTELPGASGGPWEEHRAETLRHLDRLGVGGTVWVWKQAAGANYGWGVLNADGTPRTDSGIARDYGRARVVSSSAAVRSSAWSDGVLTVRTSGAGTVELWDGAAFGTTAPPAGAANRLTVDGAPASASTVTGWTAAAPLGTGGTWAGGRRLRIAVPAGEHVLVLRPAATSDPEALTPPVAADPPTTDPPTAGPPTTGPPTTDPPTTDPPTTDPPTTSPPTQTGPSPGDPVGDRPAADVPTTAAPGRTPAVAVATPRPIEAAGGSKPIGTPPRRASATPAVASSRVTPARFRPAGAANAAARRGGTRLTIVLTHAARVRVVIERRSAGRVRDGRCVTTTRAPRGAERCTRFVAAATQSVRAAAGRTTIRLTGRAGGRPLPPGPYRVVTTPTGARGPGASSTTNLVVLPAV